MFLFFHESEWLLFNFNFIFNFVFTKTVHKFRYIKDLKLVVIKYYLYNLYETSSVNVIKRDFGGIKRDYLVLTIFNKGAYLTFRSVFHKALNLFSSIAKIGLNPFLGPASIKQQVYFCFSRLEPTTDTLRVKRRLLIQLALYNILITVILHWKQG